MSMDLLFTVAALVCFVIAAAGGGGRINLVAAGLALLTATLLL